MTRIGHVDQVLLLLRERLQRLDRSRSGRSDRGGSARRPTAPPIARLQAIAAVDALPDHELRRTLVRALLAEEMGEAVASDPAFQGLADEVFRVIDASDDGRALIDAAARRLRGGT